jgi:hypothetical protein
MGIWQRGTTSGSVSGTSVGYTVDRFYGYAGTGNVTISQSSDVPSGFTYSCSMVGQGVSITQRIESKNCVDLSGATVTVSFWAKSTAGSDNLVVSLYTATGGADNYSSQTSTSNIVSSSPSGSWTYYTTTFTGIPSTATNGVGVNIGRGSNATSTTLITGVQLEKGTIATSFDYRPYGTELALCQRYCYRLGANGTSTNNWLSSSGAFSSSSSGFASGSYPVIMRTIPSLVTDSSTLSNYAVYTPNGGAYNALTAISVNSVSNPNNYLINVAFSSGGTAGQVCYLCTNGQTTYGMYFQAEL